MTDDLYDRVQAAAKVVRERATLVPQVGLILGSGLGAFAESLEQPTMIDYADIPGFPRSHVHGHKGRLVIGTKHGVRCIAMQGRVHVYEGHSAATAAFPARVHRKLLADGSEGKRCYRDGATPESRNHRVFPRKLSGHPRPARWHTRNST